jgi:excinuclease UvrABC ATPase subunit
VRRALAVDQSPIGRTPRSVPATFLGVWDEIRKLFAGLPEARARLDARALLVQHAAGRTLHACQGQGAIVAETAFLPEVVSPCESCLGLRFEPSTLDVKWAGLSVGGELRLSAEVFTAFRRIEGPLRTITELGCSYRSIGQGSNTLSGGEAQRLKLASELTAGMAHEPTVYVLDEPTTGLHLSDVGRLVKVLDASWIAATRSSSSSTVRTSSPDWVGGAGPGGGRRGRHDRVRRRTRAAEEAEDGDRPRPRQARSGHSRPSLVAFTRGKQNQRGLDWSNHINKAAHARVRSAT